jgi:hypothetical protein
LGSTPPRKEKEHIARTTVELEGFNDLIGTRTCNLPACSITLQPSAPPRAPKISRYVEVKVELFLLIKKPCRDDIWEWSLDLDTRWRWSASCPGLFTLVRKKPW